MQYKNKYRGYRVYRQESYRLTFEQSSILLLSFKYSFTVFFESLG